MKNVDSSDINKQIGNNCYLDSEHQGMRNFNRVCRQSIYFLLLLAVSGLDTVVWAQLEEVIVIQNM